MTFDLLVLVLWALPKRVPGWWFYSDVSWRGWQRSSASSLVAAFIMAPL